jgi:plasmid stability protein
MTTLTIKNVPEELYKTIKHQAELHRRSLNSEIIFSLEQAVNIGRTDVVAILKEAKRYRAKTSKIRLTQKQLNAAKNRGRE